MNFALDPLYIKKLDKEAKIPSLATNHSAGYDLYALDSGIIEPLSKETIRTGISIKIPQVLQPYKVYGNIRSRSGLSHHYMVESGAGVIDEDYCGEICVILYNHSGRKFEYKKHDRIAQLVLEVYISPIVEEVDKLPELKDNNRTGGFGSTGF